jgi:hypothetical protein
VRHDTVADVQDDRREQWIETLKLRATAIACEDWHGLACEAYELLAGEQPLYVSVELAAFETDANGPASTVHVVGPGGVRLTGRYSKSSQSELSIVASCQSCWRDVVLSTPIGRDNYPSAVAGRSQVYCDTCLTCASRRYSAWARRFGRRFHGRRAQERPAEGS